MDFKQLHYFVHVAELCSFTKASEILNIAQPALSRQIRLLEVELRQNLLNRNGRGVTPTEAGNVLLEHARGILHQVDRTMEDLGRVRGSLAGRVTVGLPPSASRMLAVPLIREFRKTLPDATLSIREGLSVSMQEWLLTGRLDIALLYNPAMTAELDILPLTEEQLFFVAAKDSAKQLNLVTDEAITLKSIAALPLVIPNRPNALRMLIEQQMAGIGCKPQISLEIDGVSAILDLVLDGAGYAILPKYAVTTTINPDAYQIRPIIAPQLISRLMMATSAARTTTMTQKAMLNLIKQTVLQELGDESV